VDIRLLSGEVFNSGKKPLCFRVKLRSRCIYGLGGICRSKLICRGAIREEGLVGGSEPAVEVDAEDSITK